MKDHALVCSQMSCFPRDQNQDGAAWILEGVTWSLVSRHSLEWSCPWIEPWKSPKTNITKLKQNNLPVESYVLINEHVTISLISKTHCTWEVWYVYQFSGFTEGQLNAIGTEGLYAPYSESLRRVQLANITRYQFGTSVNFFVKTNAFELSSKLADLASFSEMGGSLGDIIVRDATRAPNVFISCEPDYF